MKAPGLLHSPRGFVVAKPPFLVSMLGTFVSADENDPKPQEKERSRT